MRKNKRWTLEDLELLEDMYMDPEVTLEEIALIFDTNKKNISQIAKYYKIKRRRYEDEGFRKCKKCKNILTLDNFSKNRQNKYGKRTICKDCASQIYKNRKKESVTNE